MPTYVLSDLHLSERASGRLFDDARQGRALQRLCARLAEEQGAELVLLGDTFDFTGMTAPRHGLDDFARKLGIELTPPPPRSTRQLCEAAACDNPQAVAALAQLSQRVPVLIVPGNHDRHLGEADGAEALQAIGIRASLANYVQRELAGKTVVMMHGHTFDSGNAEAGGSGEILTQCLHQAVLPFLKKHGARRYVKMDPDRLVALRPEEAIVSVLQRWLTPEDFTRFLRAFMDLLAENRFLPHALAFLARVVPVDQVRAQVSKADRLWERAGNEGIQCLRGERDLPFGAPRPDVLVFGHTHVLDWAPEAGERLYVNLGTWTDCVADALSPPDLRLPVLELRRASPEVVLRDLDERGGELQRAF